MTAEFPKDAKERKKKYITGKIISVRKDFLAFKNNLKIMTPCTQH